MSKFLVLLDRDGTIIEEKEFLSDPEGVVLLPGAVQGLKKLQDAGAVLVVVSNQSGIGRGYYTEAAMHAVNQRLAELLQARGITLAHFFVCPHHPETGCDCRKPGTALLEQAAKATGLLLADAYMIGDKISDIEAGKAAGCKTILVLTGYGREARDNGCQPDVVVDNLLGAAGWIVGRRV